MKELKRFLCILLVAAMFINIDFGDEVVNASVDGCKIIDVSMESVFVENTPNTLNITVGSMSDSVDFNLTVYEGDMYRKKIYEGSGRVDGGNSFTDIYDSTIIRIPIGECAKGIVNFDIYLTQAGQTIKNSASFYIYASNNVTNSLLVTQDVNNYAYFRKLMKLKGNNVAVTANPTESQIRSVSAVIMGTSAIGFLSDGILNTIANSGKSIVLFKDKDISTDTEKINKFLSDSKCSLKYYNGVMNDGGSTDLKINIYGGMKYNILSQNLSHDVQIRGKYYHVSNLSPVYSQNDEKDSADAVVKMNTSATISGSDNLDFNALMVDLLPGSTKIAVAGSDFLSDDEFSFSSETMYYQLFAEETYNPSYLREYSNYNVCSNLMDWILPSRFYKESNVRNVKTDGALTFVSMTGSLVTSSEAADNHQGTAFHNYVYLQDETGGIRVYGISTEDKFSYRTFKVNIKGYVSSYNGEKEIYVYDQSNDVTLISNRDSSIAPQIVKASQTDSVIGNLITITAKVSDTTFNTLQVQDETGKAYVYIDSYIGSRLGDWPVGTYDPRIEEGCTVSVTGIVSKQGGQNVIRIRNSDEIVLLKDKDGKDVAPPLQRSGKFGKGLQEVKSSENETVSIGEHSKEFTQYMQMMVDLDISTVDELPNCNDPVGLAFAKMMERCGIYAEKIDNITVKEAAVQILTGLGYDYFYKNNSDYNIDSLILRTKLLAGISARVDSVLTSKDAAHMVYNALEVPYFGAMSYDANGDGKYKVLDKSILDNFDLIRATGVITATHYTDLNNSIGRGSVIMKYSYTDRSNGDNKTLSGENMFFIKKPSFADYYGQRIEAYIGNTEGKIFAVRTLSTNKMYKLENNDYLSFENGYLTYKDQNNRQKTLDISDNALIYINGIAYSDGVTRNALESPFSSGDTLDKAGRLHGWYRFTDFDGDDKMDCINIETYRDYIVGDVDLVTRRIDDKISYITTSIYLDETANDSHLVFKRSDGEESGFDDIIKGDVLSICISKTDGKNILWGTVIISKNSLRGRITSVDASSMQIQIVDVAQAGSEGIWYNYVEIDPYRMGNFKYAVGDIGKFYINMNNTVIMKDINSIPFVCYAYVLQYGYLKEGIEKNLSLKVFLPTGSKDVYKFAKRVTVVSGITRTTMERDKLELDKYVNSLVNIEKNEKDEIISIAFATPNSTGKNDKGNMTIDRKYNQPQYTENIPTIDEETKYNAKNKSIGDAYLADKIVIFDVAIEDGEKLSSSSYVENRISVITRDSLADGSSPIITLFDMGDGNECAAAITVNAAESLDHNDNLFVVISVRDKMVGENHATCVTGYQSNKFKEFILDENAKVTDLLSGKPRQLFSGDAILYSQSADNVVKNISVIMNVGAAQSYLPDVYGDGTLLLPKVNFYSGKHEINYYFGLVTERHIGNSICKLMLAKDNSPYPTTILEKLQFASLIATDDNTVFYRINAGNRNNPVLQSNIEDVVSATAGTYGIRNSDLALVKTVDGTATDVILISPPETNLR